MRVLYDRRRMICETSHPGRCERYHHLWPKHVEVTTSYGQLVAHGTGKSHDILFVLDCKNQTADGCLYRFNIDPLVEYHTWWFAHTYIFIVTTVIPVFVIAGVVYAVRHVRRPRHFSK